MVAAFIAIVGFAVGRTRSAILTSSSISSSSSASLSSVSSSSSELCSSSSSVVSSFSSSAMSNDTEISDKEYLNKLLNRALKSVPFVKLDAVEEVTILFQEAVDLLETNLDSSAPPLQTSSTSLPSPAHSTAAATQFLQKEEAAKSEIKQDNETGADVEEKSKEDVKRFIPKQLLGLTVTRDYNSPRHSNRSLSLSGPSGGTTSQPAAAAAGSSGGEGGLKKASSRVPSSRAGGASLIGQPLRIGAAAGVATVEKSGASSARANSGKGLSSRAPAATTGRGEADIEPPDVGENDEERSVARPLPNKLLARAGAGGSKEYPSPKLGGRNLGAGGAAATPPAASTSTGNSSKSQIGGRHGGGRSASAIGANMLGIGGNPRGDFAPVRLSAHPRGTEEEEDEETGSVSAHSVHQEDIDEEEERKEEDEGQSGEQVAEKEDGETHSHVVAAPVSVDDDLTRRPRGSAPTSPIQEMDVLAFKPVKGPLAKMNQDLQFPATASPKQKVSSLVLLNIAKDSAKAITGSVFPQTEDDLIGGNSNAQHPPSLGPTGLHSNAASSLANLPSGISTSTNPDAAPGSRNSTPKPAFLRRLDSPESHHGKLMRAKSNLHNLINRALTNMPHMKPEAAAKIRAAFEKAVNKLESSTTLALQSKEP